MIENNKNTINKQKGFTLLELLIVISIIAILSVGLVIVLNPVETLKKSRDAQRISDLSVLKTAIGIYTTSTTTPYLASATSNTDCKSGGGGGTYGGADKIYYSYPSDAPGTTISDATLDNGTGSVPAAAQVVSANSGLTDGTGWIPINLDGLVGGSPISNWPIDPTNTIAGAGGVVSTDFVYRYACNSSSMTYEIDAQLESDAYTAADDKRKKDGGNNNNYYEVGTNLKILGTGTDF